MKRRYVCRQEILVWFHVAGKLAQFQLLSKKYLLKLEQNMKFDAVTDTVDDLPPI
jgi:hypothetical protein